jgi:hypothetical protein
MVHDVHEVKALDLLLPLFVPQVSVVDLNFLSLLKDGPPEGLLDVNFHRQPFFNVFTAVMASFNCREDLSPNSGSIKAPCA